MFINDTYNNMQKESIPLFWLRIRNEYDFCRLLKTKFTVFYKYKEKFLQPHFLVLLDETHVQYYREK